MNRLPFNVVYFCHLGNRRVVQSREQLLAYHTPIFSQEGYCEGAISGDRRRVSYVVCRQQFI